MSVLRSRGNQSRLPLHPNTATTPTTTRRAAMALIAGLLALPGVALAAAATPASASTQAIRASAGASAVLPAIPPDPGIPGPLTVTSADYDLGATAFTPPGFPGPSEVRGRVFFPQGLPGGPFPLVILAHGRHATCFQGGSAFLEWPCAAGHSEIASYKGYDYLASVLASNGYVVASIGLNGINARDNSTADLGALGRAEVIQRHLDLWNSFTTTGAAPFGTQFVGKVDMDNVGTMGHSRGGEGVVRNYIFNQAQARPYGIKAVLPLAPVDFSRPVINGVALGVMLPYCDGDVSDLQGVHFFDDARYNVPGDPAPKHTVYVRGANHNFFNTIWTPGIGPAGAADDWLFSGSSTDAECGTTGGSGRLSAAQQRAVGLAYMAGFFREYLGHETALIPMFTGDAAPPASVGTAKLYVSYHAPDVAALRRDVNRNLVSADLSTNLLGGAVTQSGLTPYDLCGGNSPQPQHCNATESTSRQPHTTPSALSSKRGLSQVRFGWSAASAFWQNDLPAGQRDVSGFEAVQFRVGVNYKDARNPLTLSRDFRVVLTDGTGASASVLVSSVSQALFYPPGNSGPVPKVFLNTVRVPLGSFPALNLADIRSVRLAFNQSATGAVLVSDLAFATGSLGAIGPQPSLTIGDVPVTAEGDSGTKTFSFPVTLSAPIPQAVTVAFSTADGTATAPSDYTATSGTLTIPANTTTASIPVTVKGDTTFEKKETFTVNLSSPVNATIADGSGLGSIKNDDAKPSVTISDVSATEGNAGNKAFTFTVTLSVVSGANTVIPFATANGSAVAPGDYTAKTANLSIPAGSLTGTITIQVKGDTVLEGNETFFVNLSASFQATIADGQGQATIVNDD